MKTRINIPDPISDRIVWIGVGVAIFYWFLESAIHAFLHQMGSFASQIIPRETDELWMRSLIVLIILSFSMYAQFIINRRRHAEEVLLESEENHRTLVEQASDGIFIADPQGNYIDVNTAGCSMLGYSREEILKHNLRDLGPKEDMEKDPLRIDELRGGKTIISERRLICKDGSFLPVEISAKILPDGRLQGIVRDIAERKQAEEALKESKTYIENILTSIADILLVINPNAIIQSVNTAATTLLGYTEDELLGMSVGKLFEEEEVFRKQILSMVERRLQTVYDHDQEKFWSLLKTGSLGIVVVDSGGRIVMANKATELIFGYGEDELSGQAIHILLPPNLMEIHEKHRTNFMITPDSKPMGQDRILKARNKDGTTFQVEIGLVPLQIGNNTHVVSVIRDPAMRERWEFIKLTRFGRLFAEEEEEEVFLNVDRILLTKEGTRIPALMSGSVMRDETGKIQGAVLVAKDITQRVEAREQREEALNLHPRPLDLVELTEKVVQECQPMAREKGLELSFRSTLQKTIIEGDEYSIGQALLNLIDNALKYTEEGKVKLILGGKGKKFILTIQDTGIGMSDDYLKNLYEAFSQESTGYTRKFEGIGLGTALIKNYLNINNVQIDVKSTKGVGTTFTLTFEPADKLKPEKKVNQPAKPTSKISKEPADRFPVLVVEDDLGSQNLVRFLLKDSSEVFVADSVAEAKELLKKHKIELILLDLSLRGDEDGLDLARYLRKIKQWKDLPIIALTAHAFVTDRDNCLAAGCNDYLAKPITKESLLEKLREFV